MRRAVLAACAAWLLAGSALAGTEITLETRKAGAPPEAAPQRSVVEVEGRRLRAETAEGRHGALWSGEAGVLQIFDHRERSVFRIDRAMARDVEGARASVRAGIEGLPSGTRESLERMLGGGSAAPVELRPTGERAAVNGIGCRLLEALRAGVRLAEICEGPRGAAGVTPEALVPARELARFLAEVGELLPPSLGSESLDALVLAERVEGVPLRVRVWPKDAVATESRIVRAVPKAIPAERFEPPPGYSPGLGVHVRGR